MSHVFHTKVGATVANGTTAAGWFAARQGSSNLLGPFATKADAEAALRGA